MSFESPGEGAVVGRIIASQPCLNGRLLTSLTVDELMERARRACVMSMSL